MKLGECPLTGRCKSDRFLSVRFKLSNPFESVVNRRHETMVNKPRVPLTIHDSAFWQGIDAQHTREEKALDANTVTLRLGIRRWPEAIFIERIVSICGAPHMTTKRGAVLVHVFVCCACQVKRTTISVCPLCEHGQRTVCDPRSPL